MRAHSASGTARTTASAAPPRVAEAEAEGEADVGGAEAEGEAGLEEAVAEGDAEPFEVEAVVADGDAAEQPVASRAIAPRRTARLTPSG